MSEGVSRAALETAFNGRLPRAYLDHLERHSSLPGLLEGAPAEGGVTFLTAEQVLAYLEADGGKGRRTLPPVVPFASEGAPPEEAVAEESDLTASLRALTRRHPRAHYAFDLTRPGPPVVRLHLDKSAAEEVAPGFTQFLKQATGGGKASGKGKR